MALEIVIARSAARYLNRLDQPTQERIRTRLRDVASDPENFRYSLPLKNSTLRSAHVGGWRVLLHVVDDQLRVTDIEPRGQVYRNLKNRRDG